MRRLQGLQRPRSTAGEALAGAATPFAGVDPGGAAVTTRPVAERRASCVRPRGPSRRQGRGLQPLQGPDRPRRWRREARSSPPVFGESGIAGVARASPTWQTGFQALRTFPLTQLGHLQEAAQRARARVAAVRAIGPHRRGEGDDSPGLGVASLVLLPVLKTQESLKFLP